MSAKTKTRHDDGRHRPKGARDTVWDILRWRGFFVLLLSTSLFLHAVFVAFAAGVFFPVPFRVCQVPSKGAHKLAWLRGRKAHRQEDKKLKILKYAPITRHESCLGWTLSTPFGEWGRGQEGRVATSPSRMEKLRGIRLRKQPARPFCPPP